MSAAKADVLARTQPARSTTATRSTTPGSSVPEVRAERRHDARHRRGVGGPRSRAARPGCSAPGRAAQPRDRDVLDAAASRRGPPRARSAPARRPATVDRGADRPTRRGTRPATGAARGSRAARLAARARRPGRHQRAAASSTASTSGNASPNIRAAIDRNRSTSPVVSWTWTGGARTTPSAGRARRGRRRPPCRASSPAPRARSPTAARPATTPSRSPSRRSPPGRPTAAARTGRSSG